MRAICLITWTFGLLRKAIGQMLRKKGECAGPADVVEADGAIGVPRDTYAYEKKLGHLKVQKVHTFLVASCRGTAYGFACLTNP